MTEQKEQIENSLTDLTSNIADSYVNRLNKFGTLERNVRHSMISQNRALLSDLYVEHGIVQTLVDQPVDDAFSKGFVIKTSQISEEEIQVLEKHLLSCGAIDAVMQAFKWNRLFGGAGIILVDDSELDKPLNLKSQTEKSNAYYYPADCWELCKPYYKTEGQQLAESVKDYKEDDLLFYGKWVDPSRVLQLKGKQAPSLPRQKLRGWGMSEIERLIRSINQYIKNNNLIFELLDEAKVDVYKIKEFNTALLTAQGTAGTEKRIQLGNQLKNYLNALVMDSEDDYEQKQMQFSGLAEMLQEIRIGIASEMKMPLTKIFGLSASGFNSGEDDIENYNSMIESSVRRPAHDVLKKLVEVESFRLFQVELEDVEIEFPSLRVLNAEQEENVKNAIFDRLQKTYELGLIDIKQFKEASNKASLLPVQVDINDNIFKDTEQGDF